MIKLSTWAEKFLWNNIKMYLMQFPTCLCDNILQVQNDEADFAADKRINRARGVACRKNFVFGQAAFQNNFRDAQVAFVAHGNQNHDFAAFGGDFLQGVGFEQFHVPTLSFGALAESFKARGAIKSALNNFAATGARTPDRTAFAV